MELVFACEGHFTKNAQGEYYSLDGGFSNRLWSRYLSVFTKLYVIARVKEDRNYVGKEVLRADNPKVSFIDLPNYVGPLQFFKVRGKIMRILNKEAVPGRAYLCRLPGEIGGMVISVLNQRHIPYSCEVVGDPWDVFAPDGVQHPFRIYFRYAGRRKLKKQVSGASCVLYVTKYTLQKRYPCSPNVFSTNASNVFLLKNSFADEFKHLIEKEHYRLISIGSLEQMYKSPDVVIKAMNILKKRGLKCYLSWLGDGKYKEQMKSLAKELNVEDNICFHGNVTAEEVKKQLQASDLFLLVSKTEGLPRAMIEAMAQGMPCIGSKVGGIPELLEDTALVPKGDAEALAEKVSYMLTHLSFTNQQAKRNWLEAANYENSLLDLKRKEFYNAIIQSLL